MLQKKFKSYFEIEGVKGVYHVADFLAIERIAKFSWESILASVENVFGADNARRIILKSRLTIMAKYMCMCSNIKEFLSSKSIR